MTQTSHETLGSFKPMLAENSSIKLIGLGGVGGIVARYLSLFLASLRINLRLVLIEGDPFEPANADRMVFCAHGNKASVIKAELSPILSASFLTLVDIPEYVNASNIARLIQNGDIVILAVDNHATRKLVSDYCRKQLYRVCLISGGNDGIEAGADHPRNRGTYGNCQIYIRHDGVDLSPALTRYHPEIRRPTDKHPQDKNCSELVRSVPQILFTNLATASAVLNAFWLYCCKALHYSELAFDIADGLMAPVPLPAPDQNCNFRNPAMRYVIRTATACWRTPLLK